jgi:2-methylaconitate cis-trans-isomerase PrpF
VKEEDSDLLVRAVSSGDFHATIPGTTLGALNLGLGIPNTIISEIVHGVGGKNGQGEVVRVRAGHAAGVAESRVRFERGRARSVVMMRTAREIMRGSVMVPSRCFEE